MRGGGGEKGTEGVKLDGWCFEPSQPLGIISGLVEVQNREGDREKRLIS